jgi:hypothetical protein
MQVLACDAGSYFEMFKQSATGATLELCIGTTCISSTGYAKSSNFPICGVAEATTPAIPQAPIVESPAPVVSNSGGGGGGYVPPALTPQEESAQAAERAQQKRDAVVDEAINSYFAGAVTATDLIQTLRAYYEDAP